MVQAVYTLCPGDGLWQYAAGALFPSPPTKDS